MKPIIHFLSGVFIGGLLYYINFLTSFNQFLIFLLASVLIDMDHFIYHFIKMDFKAIKKLVKIAFGQKGDVYGFYLFHYWEFNAVVLTLSFFNKFFLIIFLSNMLHLFLDTLDYYNRYGNIDIVKERSLILSYLI